MKIDYSVLNDNKVVKFDKIMFLKRFNNRQHKLVTIQKPDVEIESMRWFGKIQEAKQKTMEIKLESYVEEIKKLTDMVCESVKESLTEQEVILLKMEKNLNMVKDNLISKEKLEENKGGKDNG